MNGRERQGRRRGSDQERTAPPTVRRPAAWLATLLVPVALFVALAVGLGGCLEADTLGDAPPDEVQVGDPPTWDNGIGELMQLKCGVCHVVPLSPVSPDETPDDLDLNVQFGSGEVDGAADELDSVQAQVRIGGMPLDYATPLTSAERQAILDWDGS